MKLFSEIAVIDCAEGDDPVDVAVASVSGRDDRRLLRWGVLASTGAGQLAVESMWAEADPVPAEPFVVEGLTSRSDRPGASPTVGESPVAAALVVPTGVGASMGGFIADAGPFTRVLASQVDTLVVNPNVVNGGDFNPLTPNTLYTDGFTLDAFLMGHVGLYRKALPKIGVINACESPEQRGQIIGAVEAVRAIFGVDIERIVEAQGAAPGRVIETDYGHYVGEVGDATHLLEAALALKADGCDAIAVVTDCQEVTPQQWLDHYRDGGPNPVGALEAMISRFITSSTGLPCVHAPAYEGEIGHFVDNLDPRASGEVASGSGLPCLLLGLAQAGIPCATGGLRADALAAVSIPGGVVGGVPALSTRGRATTLLAVEDNTCAVGLRADQVPDGTQIETVGSAAECIAWIAARKAGVQWPALRPVRSPVDYRASALAT